MSLKSSSPQRIKTNNVLHVFFFKYRTYLHVCYTNVDIYFVEHPICGHCCV